MIKRLLLAENTLFYQDLSEKLDCEHRQNSDEMAVIIITAMPVKSKAHAVIAINNQDAEYSFSLPIKLMDIMKCIDKIEENGFLVQDYFCDTQNRVLHNISEQQKTALTERESQLLHYLYHHPRGADKQTFLEAVWQYEPEVDTRTVETHLSRLNQKFPHLQHQNGVYSLSL